MRTTEHHGSTICVLGIFKNNSEYWLLGEPFFRGYYTVHDDSGGRLGVVPHSLSSKVPIEFTHFMPKNTLITQTNLDQQHVFFAITFSCVAVFICLYKIIPKIIETLCYKKQKNSLTNVVPKLSQAGNSF